MQNVISNGDPLKVLVLDDDPIIRCLIGQYLKGIAKVYVANHPHVALRMLNQREYDLLITDFMLPDQDGLSVLSEIREQFPMVQVIMISSCGNMETVIQAMRNGAADYLRKPFSPDDLRVSIERIFKIRELNHSLREVNNRNLHLHKIINEKSGLEEIIGISPAVQEIKKQIEQVARTSDTSVLILGESGSGKELVARGIHKLSQRSSEVFGAVNMSAIPESLFESEFFGHKKGSFTGAIADKAGWFEITNRGTLFFDEIGEMNISQQVKLLRVLEDRKYTRVGESKEQPFDVRIVAATNKTIEEMNSGKNFRADLYYRLSTFIIHIPPLRERKEDIPILAGHFLSYFNQKMRKNINELDISVLHLLQGYHFPGNVRELRNLIERAVILCETNRITPDLFPTLIFGGAKSHSAAQEPEQSIDRNEEIFDLREIEKIAILKALEKTANNKVEAARILNIEWNALHRRMQKYGIVV
ncbi:MAG TPA: sigma-54 dependent transcriptional regulator [Bacteroidales bacterium]|nr:sigma-54 dependent transcriptional regulator [Bacteroidales bacterium]HRZ48951.1 sigma-54 dependent transcriptional regulator [Bacteroidales bacterium]